MASLFLARPRVCAYYQRHNNENGNSEASFPRYCGHYQRQSRENDNSEAYVVNIVQITNTKVAKTTVGKASVQIHREATLGPLSVGKARLQITRGATLGVK